MMITFDLHWSAADLELYRVESALGRVDQFLRGPVVTTLQLRASERFAAQGDDASGKWAPLRWPTEQIRAFQGFGPKWPINIRTGDMRDWLLGDGGEVRAYRGGHARVNWPNKPSGELGEKYSTAQKGNKKKNTVARPIVAMNAADSTLVRTEFSAWLQGQGGLTFV